MKNFLVNLFTKPKAPETPLALDDFSTRTPITDAEREHAASEHQNRQHRKIRLGRIKKRKAERAEAFPFSPEKDFAFDFGVDIPACESFYLRREYAPEALQFSDDGTVDSARSLVNSYNLITETEFKTYCKENPLHVELSDQVSSPGLRWRNGLPVSHEHSIDFTPVRARGRAGRDLGEFHKHFVGSTTFRRGWSSIVQALGTGRWSVVPPDLSRVPKEEREAYEEDAKDRTDFINDALIENLYGGWKQFLHDALYCLIAGFSIFEEVYNDDGSIEKLAFIFPSSLERWILDEDERELVAVEFKRASGELYTIPADKLLLLTWDKFGNLFEGIAVMRSTIRWIQALQLFSHLEMVAAEKYGVPHTYIRRRDENSTAYNTNGMSMLQELIDDAIAAEDPIFVLPDNTEISTTSPAGAMPNFDVPKRFCLERILEPLKAEGSLIGIGQTGAFAARQDASDERISSFPYFAEFVAECLGGSDNVSYTGTIKKMEDLRFGGPILPNRYCSLRFSIGELDDPGQMHRIAAATNAGLITLDSDIENKVRENLALPPVKVNPQTVLVNPDTNKGGLDEI